MKTNLNLKLNEILNSIDVNDKPNLFLHVCCAPCSSAVLYRLKNHFNIYVIFYNPNIDTIEENNKRYNELIKLKNIIFNDVKIINFQYNHDEFLQYIEGFENEKEGGLRCEKCFRLRLQKTINVAKKYILDNNLSKQKNYICTTLSISPHKNAEIIEEIGENLTSNIDFIEYLPSDFKKEDGYLMSIKLSKQYDLYRQDYCGCEFSKNS